MGSRSWNINVDDHNQLKYLNFNDDNVNLNIYDIVKLELHVNHNDQLKLNVNHNDIKLNIDHDHKFKLNVHDDDIKLNVNDDYQLKLNIDDIRRMNGTDTL